MNYIEYLPPRLLEDGTQYWRENGLWHRDHGPAIITSQGKWWYQHGKKYREFAPAIIYNDGREIWYRHNVDITTDVLDWIKRLALPDWRQWNDMEKTLFKVSFG